MSMKVNVIYRGIVYRVRGIRILCSVITAVILLLVTIVALGVWMLISAYGEEKMMSTFKETNTNISDISTEMYQSTTRMTPSIDFNEATSLPEEPTTTRTNTTTTTNYSINNSTQEDHLEVHETVGHFQGAAPSKGVNDDFREAAPSPNLQLFDTALKLDLINLTESISSSTSVPETIPDVEDPIYDDSIVDYSEIIPSIVLPPLLSEFQNAWQSHPRSNYNNTNKSQSPQIRTDNELIIYRPNNPENILGEILISSSLNSMNDANKIQNEYSNITIDRRPQALRNPPSLQNHPSTLPPDRFEWQGKLGEILGLPSYQIPKLQNGHHLTPFNSSLSPTRIQNHKKHNPMNGNNYNPNYQSNLKSSNVHLNDGEHIRTEFPGAQLERSQINMRTDSSRDKNIMSYMGPPVVGYGENPFLDPTKESSQIYNHFWNIYNSNDSLPKPHDDRGPVPEDSQILHNKPNTHLKGPSPLNRRPVSNNAPNIGIRPIENNSRRRLTTRTPLRTDQRPSNQQGNDAAYDHVPERGQRPKIFSDNGPKITNLQYRGQNPKDLSLRGSRPISPQRRDQRPSVYSNKGERPNVSIGRYPRPLNSGDHGSNNQHIKGQIPSHSLPGPNNSQRREQILRNSNQRQNNQQIRDAVHFNNGPNTANTHQRNPSPNDSLNSGELNSERPEASNQRPNDFPTRMSRPKNQFNGGGARPNSSPSSIPRPNDSIRPHGSPNINSRPIGFSNSVIRRNNIPNQRPRPFVRGPQHHARPIHNNFRMRPSDDVNPFQPNRKLWTEHGNSSVEITDEEKSPDFVRDTSQIFLGPLQDVYDYSVRIVDSMIDFPNGVNEQLKNSTKEYMDKTIRLLTDYNHVFSIPGTISEDILPDMFDRRPNRDERLILPGAEKLRLLNPVELSLITWTFLDFWEFLIEKVGSLSETDLHLLGNRLDKLRAAKDNAIARSLVETAVLGITRSANENNKTNIDLSNLQRVLSTLRNHISLTGETNKDEARFFDPLGLFNSQQRVQFVHFAVKVLLRFGRVYLSKGYALDCMMLLFCKDLNQHTNKEGITALSAKLKSVGLKVLTDRQERESDTIGEIWRAITTWAPLQCDTMFPKCDGSKALEIVNDVASGAE